MSEFRQYLPRSIFIAGVAVDETKAYEAAEEKHFQFAEDNRDIISPDYLTIAAAREEALCRVEIERDGSPDPKRKNEVARVMEERPRVLAELRVLYELASAADDAVYRAVRQEAPSHAGPAREDVKAARDALVTALAEVGKARGVLREKVERLDCIENHAFRDGHAVSRYLTDMWGTVSGGVGDESLIARLGEMIAKWDETESEEDHA